MYYLRAIGKRYMVEISPTSDRRWNGSFISSLYCGAMPCISHCYSDLDWLIIIDVPTSRSRKSRQRKCKRYSTAKWHSLRSLTEVVHCHQAGSSPSAYLDSRTSCGAVFRGRLQLELGAGNVPFLESCAQWNTQYHPPPNFLQLKE